MGGDGPADSDGYGGGALDPSLRERVDEAIAEFQQRYDAAAAQPTARNLEALRAATDRLIRAGSRVLIELNRS
jgi:hypothetical protein